MSEGIHALLPRAIDVLINTVSDRFVGGRYKLHDKTRLNGMVSASRRDWSNVVVSRLLKHFQSES
jgi:hypothetical protein